MSKKPKFLDLYYEWMEKGDMPNMGLCLCLPNSLLNSSAFGLITPTDEEKYELLEEFRSSVYWAIGMSTIDYIKFPGFFTPLRQTIILFCAALNNEL